jgi:hypothetical protein
LEHKKKDRALDRRCKLNFDRGYFSCQKFLFGGRLVFGHDASSLFLTSFLIGGPAITFCIRMLLIMKEEDTLFNHLVLTGGVILTILVGKVINFTLSIVICT